jgi:hypothetical protein
MSVQHFPNYRFDPTCSQHGLNMAQQTFNLAQLGPTCPNFDPTWVQHAATWPQVRPVWEQLRPKLSPNMGTWPAPSCETAVSCPMLELTWTYMCIAWLQLGANWLQLGPIGPTFWGQLASPGQFCRLNSENMRFSPLFPTMYVFPTCQAVVSTQDQVAHVKPNLCPSVPKLPHVGPKLG